MQGKLQLACQLNARSWLVSTMGRTQGVQAVQTLPC
jgi:hypothetical protein